MNLVSCLQVFFWRGVLSITENYFISPIRLVYVSPFFLMGKLRTPDSERCRDLPKTPLVRGKPGTQPSCGWFGGWCCPGVQGKDLVRSGISKTKTKEKEKEQENRGQAPYSPAPPRREF